MKKTDGKAVGSNGKQTRSLRNLPSITFGRRRQICSCSRVNQDTAAPPDDSRNTESSETINPDPEGDTIKTFESAVSILDPIQTIAVPIMDVKILNEIMEGRDPFIMKDTDAQVPTVVTADVSLAPQVYLMIKRNRAESHAVEQAHEGSKNSDEPMRFPF